MKIDRCAWVFVVDTDKYSGNFEREMGSYLTGKVRKYFPSVCKVLAELYKQETGDIKATRFSEILGKHEPDSEHGSTFTKMWDTPGWFSDGVGGLFPEGNEEKALAHHRNYYLREAKDVCGLHPSNRESHKQECLRRAEDQLFKWPAGMSVAIAFTERPAGEQLDLLRKQAMSFPRAIKKIKGSIKANPEPAFLSNIYFTGRIPKITGMRLLRRDGEKYIEEPM